MSENEIVPVDLTTLGYDAHFAQCLAALDRPELRPARVAVEHKHFYLLYSEYGELTGEASGKILYDADGPTNPAGLPKVGDWVAYVYSPEEKKGIIHAVLDRKGAISRNMSAGRKTVGGGEEEQVIAANVDLVFIVATMDATFSLPRIERFVIMVHMGGARPVIILNKSDLADDPSRYSEKAGTISPDLAVIVASAKADVGIEEIGTYLKAGTTAVFVGPSGVGKSTIINRLTGNEDQKTGEVREVDGRGHHTTTRRELIVLKNGGLIIDTPGIREVHLIVEPLDLLTAFPEIAALTDKCHFRDCTHTVEKRCAIKDAAEAGEIAVDRLASFRKLQSELRRTETDKDMLARSMTKKKARTQNRAANAQSKKRR